MPAIEDLILISVDDHICEPPDMFDQHVPVRYRDRAPRVVTQPNGTQQWWYGDIRGRNIGLNAVAGKPPEYYNILPSRFDEMRPGCYDVGERVRDMDAGGQLAGLNFPNWTGFSGQVLNQGPDIAVNEIMIKAYNDWHVDQWCGADPGRFIPCGLLPLSDVTKAAAEVRRLANKGCHAVTFSENPDALKMPTIHSGYWDDLFGACCDVGTVLCLHVGSSSRWVDLAVDAPASCGMNLAAVLSTFSLVDLLWADIWWRFPNLKFSLTEGDIGWIPYFVWRAEYVLQKQRGWTRAQFPPGQSPTTVFRDHILCCFIADPTWLGQKDTFNLANVSWESDYPHSDGAWPHGPEALAPILESLSQGEVDMVTHQNAIRHYQFDPFRYRPKDRCTVGALRSQAVDVDTVTHVGRPADERDLEASRAGRGAAPGSVDFDTFRSPLVTSEGGR